MVIRPAEVEHDHRPGPSARRVVLSRDQRRELQVLLRRERTPWAIARRAQAILGLDAEPSSCVSGVAAELGCDRKYVAQWRDRYLARGVEGLKGRPRTGRPSVIGPVSRCEVIAMACGKPSDFGVEHRNRWTTDSLLAAYLERQKDTADLDALGRTTVLRILNEAEVRPHRIKMWLHSPDPNFREKVTEICELYTNPPPGAHVLCVDEKTGMQALGRKHPSRPPAPGRDGRMDYEYVRNGTRKLLACFDVRTGEVYGEMRANRTAADLVEFMEEVAKQRPTGEVHIIWDNLNIHHEGPNKRWTAFNARHGGRFHFHYTPIHASWVNQVELWFGLLHKRILRYGVFNSLVELDVAVNGFIGHWNSHECKPFSWSFTGYPLQTGIDNQKAA